MIITGIILLWTIAGSWYLLAGLGDKHRYDPWWAYPLTLPALLLCGFVGLIGYICDKLGVR